MNHGTGLSLMLLMLSTTAALAEESPRFNQIHFQVQREQATENDRMQAVLTATAEDADAASAAKQVNETMAWALKSVKAQPNVDVRSGNYQTYPTYDHQTIRAWRVSQELILEGIDFAQLSGLIGRLQARLHMTGMGFSVSAQRRATIEDELIAQAIDTFQQRAELVRKQFKATRYRLVDVNIDSNGARYQPIMRRDFATAAAVAAPVAEGGTSKLTVNVTGTIELQ